MLTDKHLVLIKQELQVIIDHILFSAIQLNAKNLIKAFSSIWKNIYYGNIIKLTNDFFFVKIKFNNVHDPHPLA